MNNTKSLYPRQCAPWRVHVSRGTREASSLTRESSRVAVFALLAGAFLLAGCTCSHAILANAWHIPDNTSDLGFHMRNPEFEIAPNSTVTVYSGIQKWNNPYGTANQTGGWLIYKGAGQGFWNSNALSFYLNGGPSPNNQYWSATFNTAGLGIGDVVQYYLYLTFDGVNGVENTCVYGTDSGSSTTASPSVAAAAPFTVQVASVPVLSINGLNADYTTTHVFVDETDGDSVPLNVLFAPGESNLTHVEVFSNVNRRDRATLDADGDGIEDGILPPDGSAIMAGDDSHYYRAYAMSATGNPAEYGLTLHAQKTGAYRLTARYRVAGDTNWTWYSSNGRRDHAIVVSPEKARGMIFYELNAMTVGSQGTEESQRSTFTDLHNGQGSRPYDPVTNRFNLDYAQNLGVNWLWFQPIHPIGVDGRSIDPDTGFPYTVGSPYSVKNFFQINPLLGKANTREGALTEFTNFVVAADGAGLNIMIDEPFNHTAYDCELDASGVYYFAPGAGPTDLIRDHEARFFSLANNYCSRAYDASTVAIAPDRGDFGKWPDVRDVFFGRYAALVCQNPEDDGNHASEADWFDYSVSTGNFDSITRNVWRYFSDCLLYWLERTGCPEGTAAGQTWHGIDGLRADFGQGLPPQCWEYIVNKVRSRKWDFVFMAESLDGGPVTYRSNRHFDVLNENAVFGLKTAGTASDYRSLFESRRSAYGQSVVLLNNTSHDEEGYDDPFQALIRFAACSTVDGAPMIFYGQELGISRVFGFDRYELNFGKQIPQFKKFNSLQPIFSPANRTYGLDQLWPVYAAINQARQFSRALRSSNRYFLNLTGGAPHASIHSVAKYESPNASPNFHDVVFAFVNLDRDANPSGQFNVNITQNGSNLFGIKSNRLYNVKNIAAYTAIDPNRRNVYLIPGGIAGSNLLENGLFVGLTKVPATDGAWATDPYEAQYLKLYDVTPPVALAAPSAGVTYVIGNSATYNWSELIDPDGGVSGYHVVVGTTPGGSNVFDGVLSTTSLDVTNSYGATLYAVVSAINNAGIEGAPSPVSTGTALVDPNWIPVLTMTNSSVLKWSSVAGKNYRVWSTTNLGDPFIVLSGLINASSSATYYTNAPGGGARYYRVEFVP